MDVERYLRKYGVGQAEGTNEPLDHIATMLEFLQYLALVNAQAILPPEGVDIPEDAFRGFIEAYLVDWVGEFAQTVSTSTGEPLYQTMAQFLQAVLARFAQGHPN
jgi:TorA maturation chaperone TorD